MDKKIQDLNLSNAFLFAAAMEDEETCRLILETVPGIPVGRMRVHVEHSLMYNADFRSIWLNVYVVDTALIVLFANNTMEHG